MGSLMHTSLSLKERDQQAQTDPGHQIWLRRRDAGEIDALTAETWASMNLESAIRERINLAVRLFDTADAIRSYIERHQVPAWFDEMAALWPRVRKQSFTGLDPGLAYAAWLIDRPNLVSSVLDHTSEIIGRSRTLRFWADHHRALDCLLRGTPYQRDLPDKLSGPQVLAACQLGVIEALTTGADPRQALEEAATEFARANRDKRLMLNSVVTINPSGDDPVRFDLALWAIQKAAD
jgi:hypothetical protein